MVKFRYTGKQPILVGHKFIYQGEVHRVTPAQWAMLVARHGAALTALDQSKRVEPSSNSTASEEPSSARVGDDYPNGMQAATDESTAAVNLNNQTEKPRKRRAKAG